MDNATNGSIFTSYLNMAHIDEVILEHKQLNTETHEKLSILFSISYVHLENF